MKKKGNLLAMIVAGLFLLPAGNLWAEVICFEKPPLKPVRCLCGQLVNPIDESVSDATVSVIKDGIILAEVTTGPDGRFFFPDLKAGTYELQARLQGFVTFRAQFVLANPTKERVGGLVIMLVTSYPDNCGSYVVKQ